MGCLDMFKFFFEDDCPAWEFGEAVEFFGIRVIPNCFISGIEVALLEESRYVGEGKSGSGDVVGDN